MRNNPVLYICITWQYLCWINSWLMSYRFAQKNIFFLITKRKQSTMAYGYIYQLWLSRCIIGKQNQESKFFFYIRKMFIARRRLEKDFFFPDTVNSMMNLWIMRIIYSSNKWYDQNLSIDHWLFRSEWNSIRTNTFKQWFIVKEKNW